MIICQNAVLVLNKELNCDGRSIYIAQDVLSKALENSGKKILCNNTMLDPNADIISNKEYASITEG